MGRREGWGKERWEGLRGGGVERRGEAEVERRGWGSGEEGVQVVRGGEVWRVVESGGEGWRE